ncbi:MAG: peptidoglycan-binding protein [Bryobacterales bacterium]|nr:peptidoglycan-binding protein [Bryobacterales bacterium]
MKTTAALLVLSLMVWAGFAAPAAKAPAKAAAKKAAPAASSRKSATAKQTTKSSQSKSSGKTVAGKAPAKGKTTRRSTSARNSKYSRRSRTTVARSYTPVQQQPSPDRYREIQQALIERGYLQGDATGQWSNDSTDALRRFQQDQKLEASGKLDSLSLIALGLGPKRTVNAQARP